VNIERHIFVLRGKQILKISGPSESYNTYEISIFDLALSDAKIEVRAGRIEVFIGLRRGDHFTVKLCAWAFADITYVSNEPEDAIALEIECVHEAVFELLEASGK
jgi:hypothetical protein